VLLEKFWDREVGIKVGVPTLCVQSECGLFVRYSPIL